VPSGPSRRVKDERIKSTTLVVAPLFGPSGKPPLFDQEPAHLLTFSFESQVESKPPPVIPRGGGIGGGALLGGPRGHSGPSSQEIGEAPVLHAIDVVDLDGQGTPTVLGASRLGVIRYDLVAVVGAPMYRSTPLVPGATGVASKKGVDEVRAGRLRDGRRFLATIEPWHGTDVAVYFAGSSKPVTTFGARTLIDTGLKEGLVLAVADVDGDGDDEVFTGDGGPGTRVLAFDFDGKAWERTVVDSSIAAHDLRGGDIDGDGIPDVVTAGGK
jgi:hypothetical protein